MKKIEQHKIHLSLVRIIFRILLCRQLPVPDWKIEISLCALWHVLLSLDDSRNDTKADFHLFQLKQYHQKILWSLNAFSSVPRRVFKLFCSVLSSTQSLITYLWNHHLMRPSMCFPATKPSFSFDLSYSTARSTLASSEYPSWRDLQPTKKYLEWVCCK